MTSKSLSTAGTRLRLVYLKPSQLTTNVWNPNEMNELTETALREIIRQKGFVEPILASKKLVKGRHIIVNGEHRWQALKDLGVSEVPTVLVDTDQLDSKLLTLATNHIKGQMVPLKTAIVLHDLQKRYKPQQLSQLLGFETTDLQDYASLLRQDNDRIYRMIKKEHGTLGALPEMMVFTLSKSKAAKVKMALTRRMQKDAISRNEAFYRIMVSNNRRN